jgi:acyl dehydratase
MTTLDGYSLATVGEFVGRELGVSGWLTVDQDRIDRFAACTDDRQWIHVDVDRARRESPFGSTIAHGYLLLALLPRFGYEVGMVPPDVGQAFNYGVEKVRFIGPVKAGARIRDRVVLLAAEDRGGGRTLITTRNTIEIGGEDKPAAVAETLAMLIAR